MRVKVFTILLLSLSARAALAQQPAARQMGPRADVGPVAGPIYMDAYATPDPKGPTIHCDGKGIKCVVNARLLTASRHTPAHDATLAETTAAINRILASLKPPQGRKLCLYRSIHGPVLLWAGGGGGGGDTQGGEGDVHPARRVTDPQAIASMFGIRPSARAVAPNRLAELKWDEAIKSYVWVCPKPGENCVIHIRASHAARTISHDDTLAAATEEINRVLEQAAARTPRPDQSLCLLFTPDGPMLAWTYTADRPGRAVPADSPAFRTAAREALGLAP